MAEGLGAQADDAPTVMPVSVIFTSTASPRASAGSTLYTFAWNDTPTIVPFALVATAPPRRTGASFSWFDAPRRSNGSTVSWNAAPSSADVLTTRSPARIAAPIGAVAGAVPTPTMRLPRWSRSTSQRPPSVPAPLIARPVQCTPSSERYIQRS